MGLPKGEERSRGIVCTREVAGRRSRLSARAGLTDNAWPFVCSLAIHAVLLAVLSLPRLQLPARMDSPFPDVFWLSPLAMPGEVQPAKTGGSSTSTQPAAPAVIGQDNLLPVFSPAESTPDAVPPDESPAAGTDSAVAVIVSTPLGADQLMSRFIEAPPADMKPMAPPPNQSSPERHSSPQTVSEDKQTTAEIDAADRLTEIAAQQKRDAESARVEQLAREQEQRAMAKKVEQERLAAVKARQEQLVREQEQQAMARKVEQERLASVKVRQDQLLREQEQQAMARKLEQERPAAVKARPDQLLREQEQLAMAKKVEQERLASVKARQQQFVREQEQQAMARKLEQERLAAVKARQEQLLREQEQQAMARKLEQERLAAVKARQKQLLNEERAMEEKLAQERRVIEQARKEREVQAKLLLASKIQEEAVRTKERENNIREQVTSKLQAAASTQRVSTALPAVQKEQVEKRAAPTPSKPSGVAIPILKGDLKLVVTGKRLNAISVTFKELVMTRRKPPQESRIMPVIATPGEMVKEILIERAGAGVYTISIEPESSADIGCLLKFYEGTARMAIRDLGKQSVSGRRVVLKVLMPEGILWEDDKAFTGSIEDSDSVTKFNGQTGLTWKEYKSY